MFNCLTLKVKVKVTQVQTRPRFYGGSSLVCHLKGNSSAV